MYSTDYRFASSQDEQYVPGVALDENSFLSVSYVYESDQFFGKAGQIAPGERSEGDYATTYSVLLDEWMPWDGCPAIGLSGD